MNEQTVKCRSGCQPRTKRTLRRSDLQSRNRRVSKAASGPFILLPPWIYVLTHKLITPEFADAIRSYKKCAFRRSDLQSRNKRVSKAASWSFILLPSWIYVLTDKQINPEFADAIRSYRKSLQTHETQLRGNHPQQQNTCDTAMKKITQSLFILLMLTFSLSPAYAWRVDKDGVTQLKLTDDGKFGIGTTTPARLLTLSNTGTTEQLMFEDTDATTDNKYGSIKFSDGQMLFSSLRDSDLAAIPWNVVIDTAGSMGIGTSTPSAQLEVYQGTSTGKGIAINMNHSSNSTNGLEIVKGGTSGNYISAGDFVVNGAGNVGIGTTSPSYDLDVTGRIRTTGGLYYNYAGVQEINTTGMVHYVAYNDAAPVIRFGAGADGSYVDFNTNKKYFGPTNNTWNLGSATAPWNNAYFNGNVGIGTTSPSTGLKLDVEGKVGASDYCDVDGNNCVDAVAMTALVAGGGGGGKFVDGTVATDAVYTAGNVGIGTTTPVGSLQVWNTNQYNADQVPNGQDSIILRGAVSNNNGNYFGGITWFDGADRRRAGIASVMENDDADYVGLAFFTKGVDGPGPMGESMRISRSGNVGIGTTTPSTGLKLDVEGKVGASDYCDVDGNNCVDAVAMTALVAGGGGKFVDGSTATDAVYTAGNVGVGTTTPSQKLVVTGTIRSGGVGSANGSTIIEGFYSGENVLNTFGGLRSSGASSIGYAVRPDNAVGLGVVSSANNVNLHRSLLEVGSSLKFRTYGSSASFPIGDAVPLVERFTISTAGNVGIGTATPASKLVVTYDEAVSGTANTALVADAPGVAASDTALRLRAKSGSGTVNDLMLVRGDGRVGIGTTSPAAKFHIEGTDGGVTATLRGSGSENSILQMCTAAGCNYIGVDDADGGLTLGGTIDGIGGSNPTMWVANSSGRVGIGTTSPNSALKLDVEGKVGATEYCDEDGNNCSDAVSLYNVVTGGSGKFVDGTDTNDAVYTTGNVGVGTTSPGVKLEVSDATDGSTTAMMLTSEDGGWVADQELRLDFNQVSTTIGRIAQTYFDSDWGFNFYGYNSGLNSTPMVTMRGDGNVGIGTTSPGADLQIGSGTAFTLSGKNGGASDVREVISSGTGFETVGMQLQVDDGDRNSHAEFFLSDNTIDNGAWGLWQTYNNLGAQPFVIGNGGTERLRIDSLGKVGIGTTSPGADLQIGSGTALTISGKNGGASDVREVISSDTGLETVGMQLQVNDGDRKSHAEFFLSDNIQDSGAWGLWQSYNNIGAQPFVIGNGNTERLRIDTAGNVGIGTTSPSYALDVVGSIRGTNRIGHLATDMGQRMEIGTTALTTMRFDADAYRIYAGGTGGGGELFRITETGNVGIGTTSPNTKLDIQDSISDGNTTSLIRLENTVGSATARPAIEWYNSSGNMSSARISSEVGGGYNASQLIFDVADSSQALQTRMVINKDGDVGIGTTSPAQKLEVNGNGARLRLSTSSSPSTYYFDIESNYNSGDTINFYGTAGKNFLKWINNGGILSLNPSGGNVGIGTTTPAQLLDVDGNIAVAGSTVHTSDERLKKNIETLENSLDKIGQLRGVSFEWKEEKDRSKGEQIGVIAQEVETQFPQLIAEGNDGMKAVNYAGLIGPLIEAVKTLKEENEVLKARLDTAGL